MIEQNALSFIVDTNSTLHLEIFLFYLIKL